MKQTFYVCTTWNLENGITTVELPTLIVMSEENGRRVNMVHSTRVISHMHYKYNRPVGNYHYQTLFQLHLSRRFCETNHLVVNFNLKWHLFSLVFTTCLCKTKINVDSTVTISRKNNSSVLRMVWGCLFGGATRVHVPPPNLMIYWLGAEPTATLRQTVITSGQQSLR